MIIQNKIFDEKSFIGLIDSHVMYTPNTYTYT